MNPFPLWINRLGLVVVVGGAVGLLYVVSLFAFGASPSTMNVGYAPEQPIPFSHALHAGELDLDCRYCHSTVDRGSSAAVPSTEICMNCHQRIRTESDVLAPLFASWASGEPVRWKRVHDLPDFAFFDHSAHVTRGVGCVSCHGRVDTMERVQQVEPLSMGWCLDCHRDPHPSPASSRVRDVDDLAA